MQNKYCLILTITLFFNSPLAKADYITEANNIKNQLNLEANFNEAKVKEVLPAYNGPNAPQSSYYNNYSSIENDSRIAAKNSATGQIVTSAFNNQGDYDLSYLAKNNTSTTDVSDIINFFTKSYSGCEPVTNQNGTRSVTKTCDQYYQANIGNCQTKRVVEVASNYTYSCTKELAYKSKNCQKTLTIKCDNKDSSECNAAGIVLNSIESDMAWNYSYPTLTIGTIGDNYWTQSGGANNSCDYRRTINFNIRDIKEISVFNLASIAYDDQISLTINGVPIFTGPHNPIAGCREYGRTWTANPNLNLIPYLKNGSNLIEIRVLVGGKGEAWIKIDVKQNCCINPQEVWTEVCS